MVRQVQEQWEKTWSQTKQTRDEPPRGPQMGNTRPYIKNIKNKQNKQTIQQLQKMNKPPDIYRLTDKELRQFTDIILEINEEPKDEETKHATGNTDTG